MSSPSCRNDEVLERPAAGRRTGSRSRGPRPSRPKGYRRVRRAGCCRSGAEPDRNPARVSSKPTATSARASRAAARSPAASPRAPSTLGEVTAAGAHRHLGLARRGGGPGPGEEARGRGRRADQGDDRSGGARRLRPHRRGDRRGRRREGRAAGRARPKRRRTPTWRRPPRRSRSPTSASAPGHADRFFGLHVFNPVPRMELIELCIPEGVRDGLAERARGLVRGARQDRGRGARPDRLRRQPPAVPLPLRRGAADGGDAAMTPAAVDDCMRLGAGHPMGPLKLLDFVGLDVAARDRRERCDAESATSRTGRRRSIARDGRRGQARHASRARASTRY